MLAISIQKYYIFVLLFLLAILQSSCQQSGNKYRILVVHSYESDYVAYKDCDRLIRESLEKKGINPSIQTFYLNCEQYAAPVSRFDLYLETRSDIGLRGSSDLHVNAMPSSANLYSPHCIWRRKFPQ